MNEEKRERLKASGSRVGDANDWLDSNETRALETLAVAAHGAGVVIHGLGATFHIARDRKLGGYALLHLALMVFSWASLRRHLKRLA